MPQHGKRGNMIAFGRLAWRASELTARREPVVLVGSREEQLAVLQLLFLLAAPNARRQLSFDTRVEGCDFGPGVTFWVHGYAEPPRSVAACLLNAHTRQLVAGLPPAQDGPYATWMVKEALPGGLEQALRGQNWAAALDSVMTGVRSPGTPGQEEEVPDAFLAQFARVNATAMARPWLGWLPHDLSVEFREALSVYLTVNPVPALRFLMKGLRLKDVCDLLCRVLLNLRTVPSVTDRKSLESWITDTRHDILLSLPPFWVGDAKLWVERLNRLAPDDYALTLSALARWPTPPIPLRKALPDHKVPDLPLLKTLKRSEPQNLGRAAEWVAAVGPSVRPNEWGKVLDAVARAGEPALAALAELLPFLSRESVRAIDVWARRHPLETGSLRAALSPLVRRH